VRKEFDKMVKKEKSLSKKTQSSLDGFLKDLDSTKQMIQKDPQAIQKALNDLNQKAKDLRNSLATEQKESYTYISKYGKTIDKAFKLELGKFGDATVFDGKKDLLNEVITNHLYRQGRFKLGEIFSKEANIQINPSLKQEFFEMYRICDTIKNRNLIPALEWAKKHQPELQKRGSSLEFKLHHLQFVSFLQSHKKEEALHYAKSNFGSLAGTHIKEIQRLMGCLLYLNHLEKSPYADLVSPTHWSDIQNQFTRDCCSLMGLSYESPLYISISAGASALPTLLKVTKMMQSKKTEWSQQNELPVEIALSREYRYHSIYVCPVAKEQVSEQNPAMLLPCGHVICQESLAKIVKGTGKFKCPYCPTDAMRSSARKINF